MRFLKKIQPDDLADRTYPEQFINITLPNEIIDLHTFKLYYTGTATNYFKTTGGKYTKRFFPRLSSSVIDEIEIKIDNQTIQYIREYNYLYSILNDINNSQDDLDGSAFDTIQGHILDAYGDIQNNCKIQATTDISETTDTFFISKWLGFLNEGHRYFDCRDKNVKIRIKLAPAHILYNGINTVDSTLSIDRFYDKNYYLTNIYATVNIVDNAPLVPEFVFKDYTTNKGEFLSLSKNVAMSFTTQKNILWLLGTFTSPIRESNTELILQHANSSTSKYGGQMKDTVSINQYNAKIPVALLYSYDVSKAQKDPYLLNNSIWFDRNGVNVKSCKWSINNFDISPQMDLYSCYNETKQLFNTDYKRVISLPSFENNFFANAIGVEDMSENIKVVEWSVLNDTSRISNVGGTPIIFMCSIAKI